MCVVYNVTYVKSFFFCVPELDLWGSAFWVRLSCT